MSAAPRKAETSSESACACSSTKRSRRPSAARWKDSDDSDVYKNIFGKESVTEAAGFYGGKKLNAKSVMVELVEREGKESLRAMACKAGTKKEEGISYKAAALCGFNIVPDNYKASARR